MAVDKWARTRAEEFILCITLYISALAVSLFEMQANPKARKFRGSMSPETFLNMSGFTRPSVMGHSRLSQPVLPLTLI